MDTKRNKRSCNRSTLAAAFSIFLLTVLEPITGHAESPSDRWTLSVPVYLAAGSHYSTSSNGNGTVSSLSLYVEAVLSSDTSPYSAGLFADYSHATDSSHDGTINAGAFVEYDTSNWDSNAYVFNSKMPGGPGNWLYAGRLRYKASQISKFGLEVVGTFRKPQASALMIGYYATLTDALSLNFGVGATLNSWSDRSARIVLVWRVD